MEHKREMTRYAFMSHMEAYMKKLLTNPGTGKVDDFLRDNGIDEKRALDMLLKPSIDGDSTSAVLIRKEQIRKGDDGKDKFVISYKLPRADYKRKMRNLYISNFESNIIEGVDYSMKQLNEGSWGFEPLQSDAALDKRDVLIDKIANGINKELNGGSGVDLWDHIGIAVDFIERYEDLCFFDSIKELAMSVIKACHLCRKDNDWQEGYTEPDKIRQNINKIEDKMTKFLDKERADKEKDKKINECEGGEATVGATSAQSSGQFVAPINTKPIRRKTVFFTEEQLEGIKKKLTEDCVECDTMFGDFGYDAPPFGKSDDPAYDHKNMIAKSIKK